MTEPRVNNSQAKRLRARVRKRGDNCHVCGGEINYHAHHHDPLAFQLDHLWPLAAGGPHYDDDNVAAAHRACNRARANRIDQTAIDTAACYGVHLTATQGDTTHHAPDGMPCTTCGGAIHNPQPGVTFVTGRNWWTTKDNSQPQVNTPSLTAQQIGHP